MYRSNLSLAAIAAAIAGCATGPVTQTALTMITPRDCAALVRVTSEKATITSATPVAAGEMIGTVKATAPFCRVVGVASSSPDSAIKFEVWLPTAPAAWTGRLKVNGTGGYAGATPIARMAADVGDGFVVAGSNMGHDGGESADWTLGHPEKVKDWGLRAHYFGRHGGEGADHRVLRPARRALVLRGLLERRPAGDDDGAELSGALRRHRRRRAVAVLSATLLLWLMWTGQAARFRSPASRRCSPPRSAR